MILLMKNSSLAYEPEISLISMEPRKKNGGRKKRNFFNIKPYLIHLVLLQLFTGISSSKTVSVYKSGETLPK